MDQSDSKADLLNFDTDGSRNPLKKKDTASMSIDEIHENEAEYKNDKINKNIWKILGEYKNLGVGGIEDSHAKQLGSKFNQDNYNTEDSDALSARSTEDINQEKKQVLEDIKYKDPSQMNRNIIHKCSLDQNDKILSSYIQSIKESSKSANVLQNVTQIINEVDIYNNNALALACVY